MARKKKYTVRVAYKVYDYYTIEAKNEQEAIEQALEVSATDSLNDFTQDGEGEAIVTMIGNKSVEPEKKANEIEVLYSVDDENTKDSILAMHESGYRNDSKRDIIEKELRRIYCVDDWSEDEHEQAEHEKEFQEAVDQLAMGISVHFDHDDIFWETVTII